MRFLWVVTNCGSPACCLGIENDTREGVGLWLIMAEKIFSKTIIRQRHRFATANNSYTKISRPKRHRLNEFCTLRKKKDDNRSCRLSLQLMIKVPLIGGGFRGRVTHRTLRKKKTTTKVAV